MKPADWLLALLFPPRCAFCGSLLEQEEAQAGICATCRTQIGLARKNTKTITLVDKVVWALDYEDLVREALHDYKFNGHRDKASAFANIMSGVALNWEDVRFDLVSYVPTNRSNIRKRGFHHTQLLAKEVAGRMELPLQETMCKTRKTKAMFGLEPAERRANILGAIGLTCDPEQLRGKHILLVEDIVTTGATVSECARVLKEAGAETVCVVALAGAKD